MLVHLRAAATDGPVLVHEVPLSVPVWEQYVRGHLVGCDPDGTRRPASTAPPIAAQPSPAGSAADWRAYAFATHGATAEQLRGVDAAQLVRLFHRAAAAPAH